MGRSHMKHSLKLFFTITLNTLQGFEKLSVQENLSKADTYVTEVFVRFRKVSTLDRFELKSSQI